MANYDKLLIEIVRGQSDSDIRFIDICNLLKKLGFQERIKGDHHIFTKRNVLEILNLQPKGAKAKPYQVKQVRNLIVSYGLALEVTHDE